MTAWRIAAMFVGGLYAAAFTGFVTAVPVAVIAERRRQRAARRFDRDLDTWRAALTVDVVAAAEAIVAAERQRVREERS